MNTHEKTTDLSMRNGHISSDNGQGMGLPVGCSRFQCSGWGEGKQWRTTLVRDARSGNWICPNCHASYGQ